MVARQAHNLEVVRSSRASATTKASIILIGAFLFYLPIQLPPFTSPIALIRLIRWRKPRWKQEKHILHTPKKSAQKAKNVQKIGETTRLS